MLPHQTPQGMPSAFARPLLTRPGVLLPTPSMQDQIHELAKTLPPPRKQNTACDACRSVLSRPYAPILISAEPARSSATGCMGKTRHASFLLLCPLYSFVPSARYFPSAFHRHARLSVPLPALHLQELSLHVCSSSCWQCFP